MLVKINLLLINTTNTISILHLDKCVTDLKREKKILFLKQELFWHLNVYLLQLNFKSKLILYEKCSYLCKGHSTNHKDALSQEDYFSSQLLRLHVSESGLCFRDAWMDLFGICRLHSHSNIVYSIQHNLVMYCIYVSCVSVLYKSVMRRCVSDEAYGWETCVCVRARVCVCVCVCVCQTWLVDGKRVCVCVSDVACGW